MPTHHRPGRHELGQNFLIDRTTITTVIDLVARTVGPIIEIGSGDGALTLPLETLGRPLTGIEIDPRHAARLARHTRGRTTVVPGDFLRYQAPTSPHVLVGNLPFHETTPMLRHILASPDWTDAVLLVQWEVARRRAAVGGATLMTAQWWPWYRFGLVARVPSAAFRPRPTVDGGLMTITRRDRPLLPPSARREYQDFAHRVFTGRGRALPEIIAGAAPGLPGHRIGQWVQRHGIRPRQLPRDLDAEQWADLFRFQGDHRGTRRAGAPRQRGRR
ncbi:23S ribosomal RNA methyltransferase Erm [Streptomyces sp. NPDC005953]|uniref:23S ribosomal RNA methyltransferase Erm n=1 Tax=Streptomyces sp. NPDC005953 TaxID=3156719 RepID=UPI003404BFF4